MYYTFFLIAWLVGSGTASLEVTFSEFLATLPDVQVLFFCFWGLYIIYTVAITWIFLDDDRHVGIIHHHMPGHVYRAGAATRENLEAWVLSITILGILSQMTAVIGLLFVFIYPVTTQSPEHEVAACVAFISIWLASFFFFMRRRLLRRYLSEPTCAPKIMVAFNILRLLGSLGILIAFAAITPRNGILEFLFAVLILLEPLDDIIDILTSPGRMSATVEKI